MAHQVSWYMGQHIVYALLDSDELTLASMQELNDLLVPFIDKSGSPVVHVIIDVSGVKTLRTNIAAVHAGFSFAHTPKIGWNILISPDRTTKYLRTLISRVSRIHLRSFDALEEAMFFLQDEDVELHTLLCSDHALELSF